MAKDLDLVCINHPKSATRVRCSSCDSPICVKCMRASSVGMKCPSCASVPRRARMLGKPRHYALGALAGAGAASVAGAILIRLRAGYLGLLGPIILGYLIGALVVRASSNQRHSGIQATAAISTAAGWVAGALAAGLPFRGLATGPFILSLMLTAGFAAFRAGR